MSAISHHLGSLGPSEEGLRWAQSDKGKPRSVPCVLRFGRALRHYGYYSMALDFSLVPAKKNSG